MRTIDWAPSVPQRHAEPTEGALLVAAAAQTAPMRRIVRLLERAGHVIVAQGADAQALLESCASGDPHVAVLRWDGPPAAAGVRLLARHMPQMRLVVVVRGGRRDEVRRAVCAGADGVVEEAQLELTLGVVVRSVALGQASVPRSLRTSLTAGAADLSRREEQVLELVAQDLSNSAIAARLCVAECTVKTHVASVLSKLGVVGRDEAVAVARRGSTDITYTRENGR